MTALARRKMPNQRLPDGTGNPFANRVEFGYIDGPQTVAGIACQFYVPSINLLSDRIGSLR